VRNNEYPQKFSTTNNVPVSQFILDKLDDILKTIQAENIYQYPNHNLHFDFLKIQPYVNFGIDGIIRDIFMNYRNDNIFYDLKNYRMVSFYAEFFNMNSVNYKEAKVVYISNPNNVTLKKIDNTKILKMIKDQSKRFIIDLSYDIYNYNTVNDFFIFVNQITQKNTFVLFGLSKILGLPGMRVGFCLTENDIFTKFHQPWQITSISKTIVNKLFNIDIMQKHVDIIKKSKDKFTQTLEVQLNGDGPFLGLKSKDKEFKRFSIIDYDLYKK